MGITENWLTQRWGDDFAIIKAENTVRAEEQVFSMVKVLKKLLP